MSSEGTDWSQVSESEEVKGEIVGSAGHHPHLVQQLLWCGVRVNLHQPGLQQVLGTDRQEGEVR